MIGAGVFVVAIILAGILLERRPDGGRPTLSGLSDRSSAAPGDDLAAGPLLDRYRIVYKVDDWAGGDRVETSDEITVRRPYEGATVVRRRGSKTLVSERTSGFGQISIGSPSSARVLIEGPPALAVGDLRLDAVLDEAVATGVAARREVREVLGRRCRVYRTYEPVAGGTFSPQPFTALEYADSCIDASGLLLEEVWVTDGRVLRHRLASDLDLSPKIGTDDFAPFGKLLKPDEGGGSIREVDPSSRVATEGFFEPAGVGEGFERRGRYAVVPAQRKELTAEDQAERPLEKAGKGRIGAVSDIWERGADVVIIEQGASNDGSSVFKIEDGAPTITVDGVGRGQVIIDGRLSEIRFPIGPSGRYVRVMGTVGVSALETIAHSLHDVGPGSGLVYLEDTGG